MAAQTAPVGAPPDVVGVPDAGAAPTANLVRGCDEIRFGDRAGKVGLENLGNTCFMNAGLQCLSHIEPLAAYFLSGIYEQEVNRESPRGCRGELADAFAELQRALWQGGKWSEHPHDLRRKLAGFVPHLFEGREQQDIQEFLAFFLDGLHEDLNSVTVPPPPQTAEQERADCEMAEGRGEEFAAALAWMRYLERGRSFLVDLLQGQLCSTVTCTRCGHRSRHFDPFLYLSVPVTRDMCRVSDALEHYLEEELLSGEERWLCEGCGERADAQKKIDLCQLPPVLVLHLKRFEYDARSAEFRKIKCMLAIAEEVDLSEYCSSPQRQGASYGVVCVANHSGSFGSGHYTSTCRVGAQWYQFDDNHVHRLAAGAPVVGPQAYVIFLVRLSAEGGCYTEGHCAPLLRRQTASLPELWPHRLSKRTVRDMRRNGIGGGRRSGLFQRFGRGRSYVVRMPTFLRQVTPQVTRETEEEVCCDLCLCWHNFLHLVLGIS